MAGMSDNPLVGDYTKGISKGREYFENLRRRINDEKADPKLIASDLRDFLGMNARAATTVRVSSAFSVKNAPKTAPEQAKTGWKTVSLEELSLRFKQGK